MWCIKNVCHVSCIIMWCMSCTVCCNLMFTWTLVRSHPESKRCWVKLEPLSLRLLTASSGQAWQQDKCTLEWGQLSSVYAQKGTMKDVLVRCLNKTDVQECTLSSVYILFCNATSTLLLHTYLLWPTIIVLFSCRSCVCIITGVYFSQVKNKPLIPWVYTWFWHCHEQ